MKRIPNIIQKLREWFWGPILPLLDILGKKVAALKRKDDLTAINGYAGWFDNTTHQYCWIQDDAIYKINSLTGEVVERIPITPTDNDTKIMWEYKADD